MNDILFVSETYLKNFTALDPNLRIEEFVPFVIQAQDINLQPVLGTPFYNSLKSKIDNETLTQSEKDLLNDYVSPMIVNWAFVKILPFIKYKIVQKGILSGQSEMAQTSNWDEMRFLQKSVTDTAQFYEKRLMEFLIQNPGIFPIYDVWNQKGMKPQKGGAYQIGLALPDYGGCNPHIKGELKYWR